MTKIRSTLVSSPRSRSTAPRPLAPARTSLSFHSPRPARARDHYGRPGAARKRPARLHAAIRYRQWLYEMKRCTRRNARSFRTLRSDWF